MGPADQGQVGQVGGAAMEPVAQMVGFAPGRGPVTAGDRAAAVAHDQGGPLGGGDDPAGAADLQRLGGAAAKGGGSRLAAAWSRAARPSSPPGRSLVGRGHRGRPSWSWVVGGGRWRVTRTRVTAPSQASRRHASGCSGPTQPASPPRPPGWPSRLSRSTVTSSWGRTPPLWGSRPASRLRRASSARASARRWPPLRASSALAGRASGSSAASRVWPASGSNSPSTATMPSQVGDSHSPAADGAVRPGRRRPRGRRPGTGGRRPAAAGAGPAGGPPRPAPVRPRRRGGRAGPGCRGQHAGRGPGRWLAVGQGLGGRGQGTAEQGPGGPHQAAAAAPAPIRSRARSQPAVEPAWMPCSAPAAPRASTAASSPSHWPSRRSSQPPQVQDPVGPGGVGQPVQVLGGQLVDRGRQRRQPVRPAGRMCVRVHGGNLSTPHPEHKHQPQIWGQTFAALLPRR